MKQRILEELDQRQGMSYLLEKLITFGKSAYPKFGHVVLLAGGAGSGKGFIKDKLLGIEGISFDVDHLKKLAIASPMIRKKVQTELGKDLSKVDLGNPDDVRAVHEILGDYLKLPNKKQSTVFTSVMLAAPEKKPNIIFDVTLKDLQKFASLTASVNDLGYDPKNIHVVWVVNDIEVAKKQNAERERKVPVEILVNTHRGAAHTMKDIMTMGRGTLTKYMDGVIVLAFNKVNVDSDLRKHDAVPMKSTAWARGSAEGGSYLKTAEYVYVKQVGQPAKSAAEIGDAVIQKIRSYVPDGKHWDLT